MTLLYVLIIACALCGLKLCKTGVYSDYIDKTQTNCIKGLFILVVFVRHINQYIAKSGYEYSGVFDRYFNFIDAHVGQLLVVMFLFYSGYGVMESIKRKGKSYVQTIPKHRFLSTLLNFDVAVLAFVILDLILSIDITPSKALLSLTGWESVGNSNWYIFVILVCYLAVYISHKITPPQFAVYQTFTLIVICAFCIAILSVTKGSYWYNTMLSFPAGYVYSQYKNQLEHFVKSHYLSCLIILLVIFAVLHIKPYLEVVSYNIQSIAFALLVVLLTMKMKIDNKWLLWMGVNLFPLYIYQRIPMIAMRETLGNDFIKNYTIVYVIACLAITVLIAKFYKYWQIKLK
jgi:hypothetical protein